MAQPIGSISIELTASTQSAENSIQRVIDMLGMLKAATIDASAESRIVKSIRSIAKAAKEVDSDAGQKLARLAGGLKALSKVGDLSNLADAGKNVASIIRAVGSMSGKAGDGLDDLARGIGRTRDALNGLNDANTSKLEAIRDTLSGEMSGSLHQANDRVIERPALGGSVAQNYDLGLVNPAAVSIYDKIAYAINEATAAHMAFRAEVGRGGGIAGLLGEGTAGGAIAVFKYTADSIRDATAAYREFQAALGSGATRMLPGSTGGRAGERPLEADEIRDAARAYDDLGNSASRAADVIETEFVNPFANFKMKPLEDELPRVTLNPIDGSVADSANNAAGAFGGLAAALGGLSRMLGPVASGLGAVGKAMFAIPKYFGGQLIGNIQKATKGLTGFFNSIVRIAKYRLIRTALKLITQGINEGIKNLYSWSQTADTTFYNSMNQIATATRYMGNSFAAMAAPLVNALAPAIDFIIDKFVELFNFINQVIARISGQTTYTAAKKVAATWDDTTKKAGKSAADTAKKTTDEIKRTILGFDEINKLNGDTDAGSSGGGSGSGSGTSASSMFETRTIDGSVSSFADSLKAAFDRSDWQGLGELLGGKVNELVDKIDFAGAGQKVGYYINAWFSTKYWTLDTINFTNIGSKIAEFLNNAIKEIHFDIIGASLVQKLTIIGDLIIGFFTDFDWGQAATSFSDFVKGIFNEISKWLDKHDWGNVGRTIYEKLEDALTNLDLSGIATSFVTALGKAIKAVVSVGAGFLAGFWADVTAYWDEHIKAEDFTTTVHNILDAIGQGFSNLGEWVWTSIIKPFGAALTGNENWDTELFGVGKNIIEGIFKGISNVISGIGNWIKTHIFDPFLKWFKNVFGIASPAKTMEEPGENIIKGVLQGIINGLKNIGQWVKDNIFTPIWKAIKNAGAIVLEIGAKIITTAQALWDGLKTGWNKVTGKIVEFAANLKNDAAAWWKNAQDWWASKVGAVKNFFTNLTDNSSAWWKNAQDWWASKVGAVKNFFTNLTDNSSAWWKNAQDWWASKVGAVKDFWVKVKDDSATWWKNVQDWWSEAVSGKSVGITAKIVTLMATLWNSLRDRWDRFVSGKWLGINLRLGESSDPYYSSGGIYTQEWYDKNIKPIQNNLNNNPLDIDVNANPGSGFSGGGKAGSVGAGRSFKLEKVEDSTVKINAVYNSAGSLLSSIFNKIGTWLFGKDSTPSQDVIIKLVREAAWKDGLDKWLGTDVAHDAKIALVKSAWTTMDKFLNLDIIHNAKVALVKSKWTTMDKFLNLDIIHNAKVALVKSKWTTMDKFLNLDIIHNAKIALVKSEWTTMDTFLDLNAIHNAKIALVKSEWTTMDKFLNLDITHTANIDLYKDDYTWREKGFSDWIGDDSKTVNIKLDKYNYEWDRYSLSRWIGEDEKTVNIKLEKYNWEWDHYSLSKWIGEDSKYVTIYLTKGWWGSLSDWIGNSVTVTVNLKKGGGVVYSNGYSASFAEGGTISNGVARKFSKIPRYAGGTADAHGTLFLAGEAGPEIVGHVGGRTEILNQSQLAQTMFAAVRNAMSGVRIGGHIDNAVSGGGSEADYEAMYRAMYDAFTDAMAGSNERDREKVALMRQIAAKEFTSEPTAAGMNRAQMRANRRAGTTIMPVGT